jgi:hypothetical protein
MDTSEEYVKMCEKAVEIQSSWKPKEWDYIYCPEEGVVVISGYETDMGQYGHGIAAFNDNDAISYPCYNYVGDEAVVPKHIWLPRQDQLQAMFPELNTPYLKMINIFNFYEFNSPEHEWMIDASMEQLWLAFVMKDKFSKEWDGTDWVKDSRRGCEKGDRLWKVKIN